MYNIISNEVGKNSTAHIQMFLFHRNILKTRSAAFSVAIKSAIKNAVLEHLQRQKPLEG